MADYQKMYHLLFNKISDIIEDLQQLQQETEEIYMNDECGFVVLVPENRGKSEDKK
ncbi:MAG: hypothetical protein RR048_06015 [Oscillospiraceae bacterium]